MVVACAECGVRQTFWGTVQEIGDTAEVWQQGHHCAGRQSGYGSAPPASASGAPDVLNSAVEKLAEHLLDLRQLGHDRLELGIWQSAAVTILRPGS